MPVLRYLQNRGIDTDAIMARQNIKPEDVDSPDTRLTVHQTNYIFDQAMLLSDDECMGIHAARQWPPEKGEIVGQIVLNCKTIGEAVEKTIRYQQLLAQSLKLDAEIADEIVTVRRFSLIGAPVIQKSQRMLFALSRFLTYCRNLIKGDFEMIEVRFEHSPPVDKTEYERFFQAPVLFNQTDNAIVFNRKYLDLPVEQPNSYFLYVLERHANDILGKIESGSIYSKKVSDLIIHNFQGEIPTVKSVARELSMSVRSLQLKLKDEHTSFSSLLEKIREELAVRYLKENEVSITDISYLLGFSESSAFSRTFKRWTNTTPLKYRKSVVG